MNGHNAILSFGAVLCEVRFLRVFAIGDDNRSMRLTYITSYQMTLWPCKSNDDCEIKQKKVIMYIYLKFWFDYKKLSSHEELKVTSKKLLLGLDQKNCCQK